MLFNKNDPRLKAERRSTRSRVAHFYWMKNVADILSHQAKLQPSKVCLIHSESGRSFSYLQLNGMADRVATLLQRCGVGSGDRVILLLPNTLEYFYLFFGIAKIGAIVVPLDIGLKEPRIDQSDQPLRTQGFSHDLRCQWQVQIPKEDLLEDCCGGPDGGRRFES